MSIIQRDYLIEILRYEIEKFLCRSGFDFLPLRFQKVSTNMKTICSKMIYKIKNSIYFWNFKVFPPDLYSCERLGHGLDLKTFLIFKNLTPSLCSNTLSPRPSLCKKRSTSMFWLGRLIRNFFKLLTRFFNRYPILYKFLWF